MPATTESASRPPRPPNVTMSTDARWVWPERRTDTRAWSHASTRRRRPSSDDRVAGRTGWCVTRTRHASPGETPRVFRTRSACRAETCPAFQRQAGIVSSPTAINPGSSRTGLSVEVTSFWYRPVGEASLRGMSKSGTSWLPTTVRSGPGSPSRNERASTELVPAGSLGQVAGDDDQVRTVVPDVGQQRLHQLWRWAPKWMSDKWTMTGTDPRRRSDLLGHGVHYREPGLSRSPAETRRERDDVPQR